MKEKVLVVLAFIVPISLFFASCSEEKIVTKYEYRSSENGDTLNQEAKNFGGRYVGPTTVSTYGSNGSLISRRTNFDTLIVCRYFYDGDSVWVAGNAPDTIHLKLLDENGVYVWTNKWDDNNDGGRWFDEHRWEIKNDTLFRNWYTEKRNAKNVMQTRWEVSGKHIKQ